MTMGIALRELDGSGPVEVLTRLTDFNIQTMKGPNGEQQAFPCNTLIAFKANAFRELADSDVWEFRTTAETPGGPAQALIYVSGGDIFTVRAMSKVA